jgi:uncharacterized protein (TIGR03000 family)
MQKQFRAFFTLVVVVTMALFLGSSPVWAQRGGGGGGGGRSGGSGGHAPGGFSGGRAGGFSGGYHPGGYSGGYHIGSGLSYSNAYRPYGSNFGGYRPYHDSFYRPYYGAYLPFAYGYSPYDYAASFGFFSPYYGGLSSYPLVAAYGAYSPSVADSQSQQPSPDERPPADNAAHLQLTVPENAAVLFDGTETTQTGSVRDFATGALTPGSRYSYKITVRYTNAEGKVMEDARDIRFQAND